MKYRRRHQRFIKRLETEFSDGNKNYRGISSDLSINGLFIRTNHPFPPGTLINIKLHLSEGKTANLKGRVRRALKTPGITLKNGMGIEIIEKDAEYINLMHDIEPMSDLKNESGHIQTKSNTTDPVQDRLIVVTCQKCGIKNKVPADKILIAICGGCRSKLSTQT